MKSGTIGRKSKPAEGKKKWGSRDAIHLVHRDAIASAVFLFFCVLFLSNPQDVGFCASAACEGGGPIEPVACKLLFKKLTSTPHLPFGLLPPNVAGHKRRGGSSRKSFHLLRLHLHSTSVLLFFSFPFTPHTVFWLPPSSHSATQTPGT